MKYLLCGIAFLCAFILTSCTSPFYCPPASSSCCPQPNLVKETWLCNLNTNPNLWIQGVDSWFLTGCPNYIEKRNLRFSYQYTTTKMMVRVPDNFNRIENNGGYQVQIIGGQDHNSVYIMGPNAGAIRVSVAVHGHTLSIHETRSTNEPCGPDNSTAPVIVRIGVKTLNSLTHAGCGTVYGRDIWSDYLTISNKGRGNIFLVGKMNLTKVLSTNCGNVTVLGAITPSLCIKALGSGCVNICGKVGIQSIINCGKGWVQILGADTDSLSIDAAGSSYTSVIGYVNLKKVSASECSRVYLYWVRACDTWVCIKNQARVGLAGCTRNLNIDMRNYGRFWGGYLRGGYVYINTQENAHANITANQKLFVNAKHESSVYYYGPPANTSKFTSDRATIIPIVSNANCHACPLPPGCPTYSSKTECYRTCRKDRCRGAFASGLD